MIASLVAALAVGAADAPSSPPAGPAVRPYFAARLESSRADRKAIADLLDAYTHAVSAGDEQAFAALLLNEDIPFRYVGADTFKDPAGVPSLQKYASFRDTTFRSRRRYRQAFYNVKVTQDGPLAQVSLKFVTRDAQTGKGVWGWKALQLLKVGDAWKIASELYTAHDLP